MKTIRARTARIGMAIWLRLGCLSTTLAEAVTQPTEAYAAQDIRWTKAGARRWYSYASGGYAKGWLKDKSSQYYFNFAGCSNLATLLCDRNQLGPLDLAHCTALTSLSCSSNKLKTLDITHCPKLVFLYCSDNEIAVLNIANCPTLKEVDCSNNQLSDSTKEALAQ